MLTPPTFPILENVPKGCFACGLRVKRGEKAGLEIFITKQLKQNNDLPQKIGNLLNGKQHLLFNLTTKSWQRLGYFCTQQQECG